MQTRRSPREQYQHSRTPPLRRALRSPAFALLWTGQTISALGDGAFFIALAVVGVLTDRVGPQWVFICGGGLNLALALVAFTVRGIRTLD